MITTWAPHSQHSVCLAASRFAGNLRAYRKSRFIKRDGAEYVDFVLPSRPALMYFCLVRGLI